MSFWCWEVINKDLLNPFSAQQIAMVRSARDSYAKKALSLKTLIDLGENLNTLKDVDMINHAFEKYTLLLNKEIKEAHKREPPGKKRKYEDLEIVDDGSMATPHISQKKIKRSDS
jgi:hypothetical protein